MMDPHQSTPMGRTTAPKQQLISARHLSGHKPKALDRLATSQYYRDTADTCLSVRKNMGNEQLIAESGKLCPK